MREFSCSVACGICPYPGLRLCPLHWQVDAYHCTTREVPASFWSVLTVSSWNSDPFQAHIPECGLRAFILHHCPLPPAPHSAHPLSPGHSLSHSEPFPTSMHCFCWGFFSLGPLLTPSAGTGLCSHSFASQFLCWGVGVAPGCQDQDTPWVWHKAQHRAIY